MMKKRQFIFALAFSCGLGFASKAQEPVKRDSADALAVQAETMPEFPGGPVELMKFVNKNRQYANEKDRNDKVGTVNVTFVIEKDGSIGDNVQVLQSLSGYYDKEAIRIVKAMPKWIPGTQNGQPVRVQFNLPIRF
jgi:protein TonB